MAQIWANSSPLEQRPAENKTSKRGREVGQQGRMSEQLWEGLKGLRRDSNDTYRFEHLNGVLKIHYSQSQKPQPLCYQ